MNNEKNIFNNITTDDAMKKARGDLYPLWRSQDELREQLHFASRGIETLTRALEMCEKAVEYDESNKHFIENVKNECDKIAYLMDTFINDFTPIYQKINDQYLTEKLAGTFDKTEDEYYGSISVSPPQNNPWSQNP